MKEPSMKLNRQDYAHLFRLIGWSSAVILGFTGILYWAAHFIARM
jgi:hypothetical protein